MKDTLSFEERRESFTSFVNDLIHREVSIFFPLKKDYPLDDEFRRLCSFYSFLLFDAFHNKKPSLPEVGLFLDAGGDAGRLLQDALYWFSTWTGKGLEGSLFSFCERINELILKKAREKCTAPWLLLPDVRGRVGTISRRLQKDGGMGNDPIFSL